MARWGAPEQSPHRRAEQLPRRAQSVKAFRSHLPLRNGCEIYPLAERVPPTFGMLLGACCWAAGLVAPLPSQHISGQYHLSHAAGGSHLAVRSRLVLAVANDLPEIPLGGAELNEEVRLSVQYLGGPASRQRRVRRTKRQSREERWRQSSLAYREGHSRMSAFCSFDTLDLEGAVELFEQDARWRR